nr:hypothetical protein [Tanacetum cinerariifolium]
MRNRNRTPSETLPSKSSRKTAIEIPSGNVATTEVHGLFSAESPELGKSTSFPSGDGSPGAIASRRWIIGHGLRLAVMKCAESPELRQAFADVVSIGVVKGMSEGLRHGIEHGMVGRDLAAIEAYDPEADSKYVKALQDLKDMSSSQLKILIYPKVCDPKDPCAFKEDVLLEDAIAANRSRAEKKKCRVVCRTHRVGSTHHARSDGIPVSVPIVDPRGLAILLTDAATQTEVADKEDEPSPRLQRSISLRPFFILEWN